LWHFCVCVCVCVVCVLAQIGSSPLFLFLTLFTFLWWLTGLKILYSFLYRKYINHISPF
jgi:hypothetical protein